MPGLLFIAATLRASHADPVVLAALRVGRVGTGRGAATLAGGIAGATEMDPTNVLSPTLSSRVDAVVVFGNRWLLCCSGTRDMRDNTYLLHHIPFTSSPGEPGDGHVTACPRPIRGCWVRRRAKRRGRLGMPRR